MLFLSLRRPLSLSVDLFKIKLANRTLVPVLLDTPLSCNWGAWPFLVMRKGGHGAGDRVHLVCPWSSRLLASARQLRHYTTVRRIAWPPSSVSVLAPLDAASRKRRWG